MKQKIIHLLDGAVNLSGELLVAAEKLKSAKGEDAVEGMDIKDCTFSELYKQVYPDAVKDEQHEEENE